MFSPQQFAKETGLSYQQVLQMCKNKELENVLQTKGGYFKIPENNLDKFIGKDECVSKEQYERIVRENERLRTLLGQVQKYISNLNV